MKSKEKVECVTKGNNTIQANEFVEIIATKLPQRYIPVVYSNYVGVKGGNVALKFVCPLKWVC